VVGGNLSQSVARSAAVALLVVLVACNGGSGGSGNHASSKGSAPSTTAPPATIDLSKPIPGGSLHGKPRPPLENTGTDYVAIFKSIVGNFRWLTENPNPSLIADLYVPGTAGHDTRVPAYQYLVDNGYRWADEAYHLLAADVVSTTPDVVSVRVRDSLEFERIVDAAGNQIGNVRPRTPKEKTSTALLALGSDGRWRIGDWSGANGGAVQL
jgi:hypothetical protein